MTPFIPSRRPPPTEPATDYDYGANMRPMRMPMPSAQTGGGYAPRPSLVPQMAGGLPPSHMGRLWQMANNRPRQIRRGLWNLVP